MEKTTNIESLGNGIGNTGEIVLYQPNDEIRLDVRLEAETVWLSQQQMALLFGKDQSVIARHIQNAFQEGEVQQESNMQILHNTLSKYKPTRVYNLDVIISVGYRVHSPQGVIFRRWATSILKEYMLRGHAINQRLLAMEERIDHRLMLHDRILAEHAEKIDFFIRTSLPPVEQVFFNGEFFSARVALENLVKTATKRVVMVDGYIDALTLDILDTRAKGVTATIFTAGVGEGIKRLLDQHDKQKDKSPIEVKKWKKESHDRWLIVDDTLYHCGHSFNATGKTLSAIVQLNRSPEDILQEMQ